MKIHEPVNRVGSYSGLLYAADTSNPKHQDLEQRVEQRSTAIRNLLLFFDLEWLSLDDETAQSLTKDPSLAITDIIFTACDPFVRTLLQSPKRR